MAIDIFILWPVFGESIVRPLVLSFLHIMPEMLLITFLNSTGIIQSSSLVETSLVGLFVFSIMLATLYKIDHIAYHPFNVSTFVLLRAFLTAWINDDPESIEEILEHNSIEKQVITKLIHFETSSRKKLALIVPNVHPGPLYPIGSYNLPEKLVLTFKKMGYDECFVLHGPVDHDFNLCSQRSVNEYLEHLKLENIKLEFCRATKPHRKALDKREITYIALNNQILAFLSSNHLGSEDYPSTFIQYIITSNKQLLNKITIIDSHNAIGPIPDEHSISLLVKELERINFSDALDNNPLIAFDSFNISENNTKDLGKGGIGIVLLKIFNSFYALVWVDANNSLHQINSILSEKLSEYGIQLLQFTTSDSHFNAGKIANRRGYLLFGEATNPNIFVQEVIEHIKLLKNKLEPFQVGVYQWEFPVKVTDPTIYAKIKNSVSLSLKTLAFGITFVILSYILFFAWMITH